MTTISIIVPAYNARKGIAKCLDALLRQTGLEHAPEIIVVDDGSTDETPDIVGRYPGVRLIRQKNAGAGPARNTGIQASTGDFLLFTDSDCEPDPTWAAEILKGFTSDDIAMVMGSTRTDLGENNIYARTFQGRDYIAVRPGPTNRFNSNNLALRRWAALAFLFDPALPIYCEDNDQGWRLLAAGYQTIFYPSAQIAHHHPYTTRSFYRNAYLEGRASARLHYKHGLWIPRDKAAFLAALGALLLAPVWSGFLWLALLFFLLFLASLLFNELYFKHKPLGLALTIYPVQFSWYLVRIYGYLLMMGRILLGLEPAIRASKRAWYAERQRLHEAKRGA